MISFDGSTKTISLSAGTTTLGIRDLWSRWVDWACTVENMGWLPAFRSVGGDDIDATEGTMIPLYTFVMNGWKIKPQEASHTLSVTDGILIVDGGGDPFTNTNGNYVVRVNYKQPVQAVAFNSGGGGSGGGLTTDQAALLADIAKIHGLVPGSPLIVGPATRQAGDVSQTVVESGGVVTVTRS